MASNVNMNLQDMKKTKPGTRSQRSTQSLADDGNVDESCNNGISQRRGLRTRQSTGPAKILISNLNVGFSRSDLHELFAGFGTISETAIYYDRFGKSMGSAHVVFERRVDALKAHKKYDGFKLFGQKVSVTMDAGSSSEDMTIKASTKRLSQRTTTSPNDLGSGEGRGDGGKPSGSRGISRRGDRGRGSARRGARTKVHAAQQLQAELQAFVNQVYLSHSSHKDYEYDLSHQ